MKISSQHRNQRYPHCFWRNQDGANVIEFAIVAPVLFLLLIGIIEMGLIFFTNSALEGATDVGARIGKSGYTNGQSREDYIRQQIENLLGGYLDPARLTISILSYSSFANVGKPEPCITALCGNGVAGVDYVDVNGNGVWDADQGKSDAGGAGDIVLYRTTYLWPLFTPMMAKLVGDANGNYTISVATTVRNEPN